VGCFVSFYPPHTHTPLPSISFIPHLNFFRSFRLRALCVCVPKVERVCGRRGPGLFLMGGWRGGGAPLHPYTHSLSAKLHIPSKNCLHSFKKLPAGNSNRVGWWSGGEGRGSDPTPQMEGVVSLLVLMLIHAHLCSLCSFKLVDAHLCSVMLINAYLCSLYYSQVYNFVYLNHLRKTKFVNLKEI